MKYRWKVWKYKADPDMVGARLEDLRQRANGPLTAEAIVDDARPADSPLHPIFEWDDTKAAEEHRRSQARVMLGNLIVVMDEEQGLPGPREARAFVRIERDRQSGYESAARALSDEDARRQILAQAFIELQQWQRRYRELEELADIFEKIDEAKALLDGSK